MFQSEFIEVSKINIWLYTFLWPMEFFSENGKCYKTFWISQVVVIWNTHDVYSTRRSV